MKPNLRYIISYFFCLLIPEAYLLGQQSFGDSLARIVQKQNALLPQEKMYVQTDKTFYSTGETIWYKIYTVDASFHQLLGVSKIAYVEILNAEFKPVIQAKIGLENGLGDGFFEVPASVASGNYHFRAYTSWMKNFDPDFYFERTITIVNPLKNAVIRKDTALSKLRFFPEGGNLVYGLESKIGFEAVDKNGTASPVTGSVINQRNDTIASFRTFKFGLGNFNFTPMTGNSYKVICQWSNGQTTVHSFPSIAESGYVIQLLDEGDQLRLNVRQTGMQAGSAVFLITQTRQQVRSAMEGKLENGRIGFVIAKHDLGEGISQLTLFNEKRQPVAERLYFKQPQDTIHFEFQANKNICEQRGKIELGVTGRDEKGESVHVNASVSVFLSDSFQSSGDVGIASYFYLVSDLKGRIDSPDYYLNTRGADAAEATDNLMLTHGWRRFDWNEVSKDEVPMFDFLPEYNGHIINATMVDRSGRAVTNGTRGYLSIPAQRFSFAAAVPDSAGRLRFQTNEFYGAGEIVLQTNYEKDSGYRIDFVNPFSERFSSRALPSFSLQPADVRELSNLITASQVSRVFTNERSLQYVAPAFSDTTSFYGRPDAKYFLDDYTRFGSMEEVLREYVSEVQVRKIGDKNILRVINLPYKAFFEASPLVLIDGVPIFNMDKVIRMDPLKIKKLEVVSRKFYQDYSVYPGIMSYSTYQGDLGGFVLDPNAIVVRYDGLQIRRQFYSPLYESPEQQQSRLPDFRTTLYWSADLQISQQTKQITFYTSDVPGTYVVIIEGITKDGKVGSGRWSFEVKGK